MVPSACNRDRRRSVIDGVTLWNLTIPGILGGFGSSHKRRSPCRPQRHSWRLRLAQQATRDQASSPRRCPLPSACHLWVFWRRHWSGGQSKPLRSTSRCRRVVRRQLPPRPSTSDGPWPAALRAEGANIWPVVLRARGTTVREMKKTRIFAVVNDRQAPVLHSRW